MVCHRARPLIYFDLCIRRFVITTTLFRQDGLYGHHAELLPSVTSSRGPWRGAGCQTFRTTFRQPICSRSAREIVFDYLGAVPGLPFGHLMQPGRASWDASQIVTNFGLSPRAGRRHGARKSFENDMFWSETAALAIASLRCGRIFQGRKEHV